MNSRNTRGGLVLAILSASLCACASGPRGPSNEIIARALQGAPGEAQPSTIVATELAYARAAREDGLIDASRAFAASDAVLHGRNGPVPFAALSDVPNDPANTTEWGPRVVVQSCDGALALSQGRFRDADGMVGNYVTVWTRQQDASYRWSYDVAGRDDPQPAPRPPAQEGDIVVTAMDAVEGLVATCGLSDGLAARPTLVPDSGSEGAAQVSRDGTLQWMWEHRDDGTKRIVADYFFEGEWQRAIEENLASPIEE